MKYKIAVILILSLCLPLGYANSSRASILTVTDTTNFFSDHTDPAEDIVDYGGFYLNKLEGAFDWVRWTHHFAIPTEEPVSATLTVYLQDDCDGPWYWTQWELGYGIAEDGTWDFGEIDTGAYTYSVSASYLMDGMFSVKVGSISGDFYIKKSELEMTSRCVPIPSSLILMLSGATALMGIRRRIFSM